MGGNSASFAPSLELRFLFPHKQNLGLNCLTEHMLSNHNRVCPHRMLIKVL